MSRLIDADKLNEEFQNHYEVRNPKQNATMDEVCMMLFHAPTVDAVPVVRCRECVHYEMGICLKIYDDGAASSYAWQKRKPDDFCSYGERKEGAD